MNPIDLLNEPSSDNQLWKIVEILSADKNPIFDTS